MAKKKRKGPRCDSPCILIHPFSKGGSEGGLSAELGYVAADVNGDHNLVFGIAVACDIRDGSLWVKPFWATEAMHGKAEREPKWQCFPEYT